MPDESERSRRDVRKETAALAESSEHDCRLAALMGGRERISQSDRILVFPLSESEAITNGRTSCGPMCGSEVMHAPQASHVRVFHVGQQCVPHPLPDVLAIAQDASPLSTSTVVRPHEGL